MNLDEVEAQFDEAVEQYELADAATAMMVKNLEIMRDRYVEIAQAATQTGRNFLKLAEEDKGTEEDTQKLQDASDAWQMTQFLCTMAEAALERFRTKVLESIDTQKRLGMHMVTLSARLEAAGVTPRWSGDDIRRMNAEHLRSAEELLASTTPPEGAE